MIRRAVSLLKGKEIESILARGSLLAFLIQGSGAALILLTEVVVARLLGVSQFGIYSMATAWIYVLALLATLGFNHALLRYVPFYLAQGDLGSLRGIIRRSNLWAGLAALIIASSGIVALHTFKVDAAIALPFILALLAIPFQVLSSLRQAVLRGMDKIAHALAPEFIFRPVMLILLLLGMATIAGRPLEASTAFSLSLVAVILSFGMGAFWQYRLLPKGFRNHAPVYRDREWLHVAMPLLLIVGLNLISGRIDVIMLGMLSSVEHVGIYSAASRVADVIVFGLVSANAVLAPLISRLHSTGSHEELQKMVALAAKGIFLFTVPVALFVVVFGEGILAIFGQEFNKGYQVLVILVCGQLVNALAGPVGYLMTMTGHQMKAAKMVAASAVLNLALNSILIPYMGMTGAAIATAMSTATWNILMMHFVKRELSIQSSVIQFLGNSRA